MCVRKLHYLVCTRCNNQFHSASGDHYGETAREIRDRAKSEKWVRCRVENGSMWDLCPHCYVGWLMNKWSDK